MRRSSTGASPRATPLRVDWDGDSDLGCGTVMAPPAVGAGRVGSPGTPAHPHGPRRVPCPPAPRPGERRRAGRLRPPCTPTTYRPPRPGEAPTTGRRNRGGAALLTGGGTHVRRPASQPVRCASPGASGRTPATGHPIGALAGPADLAGRARAAGPARGDRVLEH